jgi:hypothetical protein
MESTNPVLTTLRALGVDPPVGCVVGEFHSIPYMVRGSDRIEVIPSRMTCFWPPPECGPVPVPFETSPVVETLWWHVAHRRPRSPLAA